ncbi:hypothetical protein D9M72_354320 [compost metagenome]
MHHATLNRARPNDRHFDDEVIEGARLQAGQHRHLGARLNLEHAHRIRPRNHLVGLRIFRWDVLQLKCFSALLRHQIQGSPDRRQHAEREHVNLEQPQGVKVVLVPLDHAAIGHGRVLDWHQPGKLATREHKTSCVLGEMPREAKQRHGHVCPALGQFRIRIHAAFAKTLKEIRFAVEPMVRFRDQVDDRGIHT